MHREGMYNQIGSLIIGCDQIVLGGSQIIIISVEIRAHSMGNRQWDIHVKGNTGGNVN